MGTLQRSALEAFVERSSAGSDLCRRQGRLRHTHDGPTAKDCGPRSHEGVLSRPDRRKVRRINHRGGRLLVQAQNEGRQGLWHLLGQGRKILSGLTRDNRGPTGTRGRGKTANIC